MASIEPIIVEDILLSDSLYYFGYDKDYIQEKEKSYQTRFVGDKGDAYFKFTTDLGEEYIGIFKLQEYIQERTAHLFDNFLLLNNKKQVIINVYGCIYRFQINEKSCKNIVNYYPSPCQFGCGARSSQEHQIMVLVSVEGLIALNWEKELWSKEYPYAYAGYLEILAITNEKVLIKYDAPIDSIENETLNLFTGES